MYLFRNPWENFCTADLLGAQLPTWNSIMELLPPKTCASSSFNKNNVNDPAVITVCRESSRCLSRSLSLGRSTAGWKLPFVFPRATVSTRLPRGSPAGGCPARFGCLPLDHLFSTKNKKKNADPPLERLASLSQSQHFKALGALASAVSAGRPDARRSAHSPRAGRLLGAGPGQAGVARRTWSGRPKSAG